MADSVLLLLKLFDDSEVEYDEVLSAVKTRENMADSVLLLLKLFDDSKVEYDEILSGNGDLYFFSFS